MMIPPVRLRWDFNDPDFEPEVVADRNTSRNIIIRVDKECERHTSLTGAE